MFEGREYPFGLVVYNKCIFLLKESRRIWVAADRDCLIKWFMIMLKNNPLMFA